MTSSPRLSNDASQTTKKPSSSASTVLLITALDTTWRAFVPTIGSVFVGIGLDHLFGIAPVATVICLSLGALTSALLIAKQLRDVRRKVR